MCPFYFIVDMILTTQPYCNNFLVLAFVLGTGTDTSVTVSSGQTFQITGTSGGAKVVSAKLPLPANSKIVTVNVPNSQGGTVGIRSQLEGLLFRTAF